MIDYWGPVAGIGACVVWTALWAMASYSELDSEERESPVRMGFYLAILAMGVWVVLTAAILGIGWVVWSLIV